MSRRIGVGLLLACVAIAGSAVPAYAQRTAPAFGTGGDNPPHTVNFLLGAFVPRGQDARVEDDVLSVNQTFLVFDLDEFRGPSIGAEWLIPIGNYVEAGAGLSFYRRTVPSNYRDFIDSDGTEIDQELRLRMVPLAFTARVLPLGQAFPVQPYIGAGLAVIPWRYSEFGEFIDFSQGLAIFEDTFAESGTETGPIFLGGLRYGGETFTVGGEIRYQRAEGELGTDFAGSKLDLGGWTYQFTVGYRFFN